MSGKQFLVLLVLFMAYLMLGAAVFHYIENPRELATKMEQRREEKEIISKLGHRTDYLTRRLQARQHVLLAIAMHTAGAATNVLKRY